MKILVLGSNGMTGHVIALYLKECGYQVTGFAKQNSMGLDCIIGDATDTELLNVVLQQKDYDYVINCIGILNKAVDKKISDGIYINSYLPHYIAERIKDSKTRLIHLSTDCVFSGKTGGYIESSFRDADSLYGRTKALGEVIDEKNLTLRTSIVGPELTESGVGLFHWFMKQQSAVSGYTGAIWTGVTTITLAKAIEQVMKQNITGLYHLVNNSTISKYELLNLFNLYCNESKSEIKKSDFLQENKSLINTRTDFEFIVPTYEGMMKELTEWMQSHAALYHYDMI